MGTIGWLIWCNVMVISFFAALVSRFMPMMASKTTDHNQLVALKARVDTLVAVHATIAQNHATQINTALTTTTAVAPIATAGNASFLSGLSSAGSPAKIGSDPNSNAGSPPSSGGTVAGSFGGSALSYMVAFANLFNSEQNYIDDIASDLNSLYDALQSAGIIA